MNKEKVKILIVDDEDDIVEFVGYNLKKEGYQVLSADNGDDALRMVDEEKPNLVLLDIMMPQIDGVEVCRIIRSKPEHEHILIAFLTARNEDYSQVAALDVGGDDYITKPIRPRVLVSRINALLRRAEKAGNSTTLDKVIEVGNFIIDRDKVSVQKGDKNIHLAKKEFELLVLLVSKPGKVFSREEIFSNVWGSEVIVGNRTIDVHIRKLREKIGNKYIKTVKGIGYKFEF